VSDYDMPINGDLWTDIRELKLPLEITSVLTDNELKDLLFRMIDSNYKQRPTAKDVLDSPIIREEVDTTSFLWKKSIDLFRFVI
jgi:serine/threonine protein kinase